MTYEDMEKDYVKFNVIGGESKYIPIFNDKPQGDRIFTCNCCKQKFEDPHEIIPPKPKDHDSICNELGYVPEKYGGEDPEYLGCKINPLDPNNKELLDEINWPTTGLNKVRDYLMISAKDEGTLEKQKEELNKVATKGEPLFVGRDTQLQAIVPKTTYKGNDRIDKTFKMVNNFTKGYRDGIEKMKAAAQKVKQNIGF